VLIRKNKSGRSAKKSRQTELVLNTCKPIQLPTITHKILAIIQQLTDLGMQLKSSSAPKQAHWKKKHVEAPVKEWTCACRGVRTVVLKFSIELFFSIWKRESIQASGCTDT